MKSGTVSAWPVATLLLNALVWGVSWWPLRELAARGLHPLWTMVVVFTLSAGVIVAWRPSSLRQLRGQPVLWVLAAASGVTNAAFNWAVSIGEVTRVVLLFYLMPLWTVLLARVLLHEPLTRRSATRVALALTGAAIVLWPPQGGWPGPRSLADWLAVLGGFAFAFNSVMVRRVAHRTREEGRAAAMLIGCIAVAGVMAAVLTLQSHVDWPPAPAWGWVTIAAGLALAFVCSNLAYQFGASRLPANVTAVVMLTEVVFASVSSMWIGGEQLRAHTLVGGTLIIAAALLAAWPARSSWSPRAWWRRTFKSGAGQR
ncbi:DMT family transporter [Schlegelella aquatica]|uniref:DMT family transporter n=1 Tax=Caldimonas aquatica TaxID=376175 RepID=UPI003752EB17